MMPSGQPPRTSPLTLLTFCLSLLAVALSGVALLMIHDHIAQTESAPAAPTVSIPSTPSASGSGEWNWDNSIARVERFLDQAYNRLTQRGEKAEELAGEQVDSAQGEIAAWREKAEPRLQEGIAAIVKQAEDVRAALREKSGQAAEKLESLRQSLKNLREKIARKEEK
ncbi:MAG: hypothetical protein N3D11_04320 [Candidatus Sumerlaeia bacterium]|nr:hypothetical protein [Candidatus Sumerlaeia bacterium]